MRKAFPIALLCLVLAVPAKAQTPDAAAPAPAAAPATPAAAPAAAAPKPSWMAYQSPYTGEENNLANPHRTTEEIIAWAQQTTADVLSFGPDDYQAKMNGFKKYFSDKGWQLYSSYLTDAKILPRVTDDRYSVGAVVDSAPEILNAASSGEAYHWIIKAPITISFFGTNPDGSARPGSTGKYTLFMDLQHVPQNGKNEDGIAINNWRVDVASGN